MTDRIKSYKEFWPYYLNEHAKPLTREVELHVAKKPEVKTEAPAAPKPQAPAP